MRLEQEGSKRGNPIHSVLAQRIEHDVVCACGVHSRQEDGGRRYLERWRFCDGRSRRLGDREGQRESSGDSGRGPNPKERRALMRPSTLRMATNFKKQTKQNDTTSEDGQVAR